MELDHTMNRSSPVSGLEIQVIALIELLEECAEHMPPDLLARIETVKEMQDACAQQEDWKFALEHVTELLVDTWSTPMEGNPENEWAVVIARRVLGSVTSTDQPDPPSVSEQIARDIREGTFPRKSEATKQEEHEICNCPSCGRSHWKMPFGKPPSSVASTNRAPNSRPKKCEGCGQNYADPPSKLCPGCQAYREHQA
jgi:hypothetical protein